MNSDFWDSIADYYEAEIFNVLKNDQKGIIQDKLTLYGEKGEIASDIGCGIGNFLPVLSNRFKKVFAVDFSAKCIARAQEELSHLSNITYLTEDLADPNVQLPKVNFALSVNSVITPSMKYRNLILDAICQHIKIGGYLVLVVPSLESAFYVDFRLIEWNLRDGMTQDSAIDYCVRAQKQSDNQRLHEGIVLIDDVETKHFLKEELMVLLKNRSMEPVEFEKIEYPWKTEYFSAPRWMKDPLPWDWLVIAKKVQ